MNIRDTKDTVYEIACEHGWHDEDLSDDHYLMMIVSEMAEAVQADRSGKHANKSAYNMELDFAIHDSVFYGDEYQRFRDDCFDKYIKDTVEDELADVVIRCLDLAGHKKFELLYDEVFYSAFNTEHCMAEKDRLNSMTFTETMLYCTRQVIEEDSDLEARLLSCIALIILYSTIHDIDIDWFVSEKIEYNRNRPYKHGKKY